VSQPFGSEGFGIRRFQYRDSGLQCRKPDLQGRDLGVGGLLAVAGVGGEFLNRLEFLAPHQIHPLDQIIHPGPHHRLGFVPQPGQGGNRTAGHTGNVIKKSRTISHRIMLQLSETAFLAAPPHVYSATMILITGGAGFIGSNLQAALSRRGHETVVVDTLGSDDKWRNLAKHAPARIVHPNDLHTFLDHYPPLEMVFHLGAVSETTAVDGDHTWATNVELSRYLWEWCAARGVRLVYASSAATYGDGGEGFEDDIAVPALERLRPLNLYGWTKHAFDMLVAKVLTQRREQPSQWVGLKFFNVYGPNEYHKGRMISVVKVKHDEIASGAPARLFRSDRPGLADGDQQRDFIWVGDVVDVMLWLMETPSVSGLFNLGTGQARTYLDLAHAVSDAAGKPRAVEFIDMPPNLRGQYQSFTQAPMQRLRAAGYTAAFTPLEEGIRRYVQEHLATPDIFL
jgi:ADP-L-glycero-D-manno-heptose 6-epimerase